MAGYLLALDVSREPKSTLRTRARRLKRAMRDHKPFKHRTWKLSESAEVIYYKDQGLLVCRQTGSSTKHYASYLILGTRYIVGHNWIERAAERIFPDSPIVRQGIIG